MMVAITWPTSAALWVSRRPRGRQWRVQSRSLSTAMRRSGHRLGGMLAWRQTRRAAKPAGRAEHLGRGWRPVPARLVGRDRGIGRQGDEAPSIGGVEAWREPGRRVAGRPRRARQEAIVELAKARAAPPPDVAPLELGPQSGPDGTCVGTAMGGAVGPPQGAPAFGEPWIRPLRGPAPWGLEVTEEGPGVQERRRARGRPSARPRLQEGWCALPQRARALPHQGKHRAGVGAATAVPPGNGVEALERG